MSIFKTKAIILKIDKIYENNFLYTMLTYDFGKIKVNKKKSKKEKTLDLGYIINSEIVTNKKQDIHKIRNIKILSEFSYENKPFSEINSFLELLALINNQIPENLKIIEIFNIIETINYIENITKTKLLLSKIKILNKIGILDLKHKNKIVQKILKFINNNNIKNILRLTGINHEIEEDLKKLSSIKL